MARTARAIMVAAALALLSSGAASATAVYWTPAHELAPPDIMGFISWGDLDADGDDDVSWLSARREYWNDGGCPGPPVWRMELRVMPAIADCAYRQGTLGDLDADGDLDLVSGCFQPGMHMHWNVGTPQVPQWQDDPSMFGPGSNYTVPCLADLDGDGDLDIVAATGCAAVFFGENTGTPQAPAWGSWQTIPPVLLFPPAFLAVGDLDGDGDLDILGMTDDSPLQCWENVGTPQVWSFVENPAMLTGVTGLGTGGWGITLPDVDCDGDPDLFVIGQSARYLYLNDSISSVAPSSWGTIKALYR